MDKTENDALQIAIIGMAGRFPGAKNVLEFWHNIKNGVESISFFSDDELENSYIDPVRKNHPDYVKARGILGNIADFDAAFFDINPREAEIMDPQQRLFLECAWEALENAGYTPASFQGQIGIVAGSYHNTYLLNNLYSNPALLELLGGDVVMHGNASDHLATHIAYKLNLKGPSFTIQTACSTSLVAVHQACQSLLVGECDMALAGGVCVSIPEKSGYLYQEGGILSPDGHCHAFDAKAEGTVFGNGLGIVVLKRLDDALAAGDNIVTVIKGSAINNDGSLKVGYMAPSVDGQANVIAQALAISGVEPDSIGYIETHGTGTAMGDTIEVTALNKVYSEATANRNFCALGSVKTNIGHLNAASGIAGLIKSILVLQHKTLPPSLHFENPNPRINFADSPFYVNRKCMEWRAGPTSRRAGLSSFGVGGTNVHMILEEANLDKTDLVTSSQLLLLSAKTTDALDSMTANLREYLKNQPDVNLADVAFTLQVGREPFNYRRMAVCKNTEHALQILENSDLECVATYPVADKSFKKIVFIFAGSGNHYVNMALGLYQDQPLFREQVDHCAAIVKPILGYDLTTILYPLLDEKERAEQQLQHPAVAEVCWFVIEYALAKLWLSLGVQPQLMIGHGVGEYVAACLAEVFSLEDALRLVVAYGQLTQQSSEHAVAKQVKMIKLNEPQIPYFSTFTEELIIASDVTNPDYWVKHSHHRALFSDSLECIFTQIAKGSNPLLLEMGPGQLLTLLAKSPLLPTSHYLVYSSLRSLQDKQADREFLLDLLGKLWLTGISINWSLLHNHERRLRIPLPTYPFQRQPYWIEARNDSDTNNNKQVGGKNQNILDWFYVPSWQQSALTQTENLFTELKEWLVFANDDAVSNQIIKFLQDNIQTVTKVLPGEQFAEIGMGTFMLNPHISSHYDALIDALYRTNKAPNKIIHLWNITGHLANKVNENTLVEQEHLRFYSLLSLAQALGKQKNPTQIEIYVLTNNMQEVVGGDLQYPEKATVLGPCRVISQEYPSISCSSIDIDVSADSIIPNKIFSSLMREFTVSSPDKVVAYRGNYRWVQKFQPWKVNALPTQSHLLRKNGVYLITGGMGGIGLSLAEYLAENYQAKLVLIGRSKFPQREEWAGWIKQYGEQDKISKKIKKIKELETKGAVVLVLHADVTEESDMTMAIAETYATFSAIHGVIHAAGVAGGGLIQSKTFDMVAEVFKPKINGAIILCKLLRETKLDFLLFCSSIGSILSAVGQVDYCAANAFLDALAHYTNTQTDTYTLSVNWDTWQDVGMAVETPVPALIQNIREESLKQGILSHEAQKIFPGILTSKLPQIIISTQNLQTIIKQHQEFNIEKLYKSSGIMPQLGAAHSRPNLPVAFVAPTTEVEIKVVEILEEILGISGVGVEDNFFDLGGHSLLASQVLARFREIFAVDLSLDTIFTTPTAADLAIAVEDKILAEIEDQ